MSAPGNTERTCPRCSKPGEFYAGNSACKECVKARVRANYKANRAHYVAYEKEREKTDSRKASKRTALKTYRARNPEKNRARQLVMLALRSGKLIKQPCACGNDKAQAHHHDYSKPLDVEWLCVDCHWRHHNEERKAA